MLRKLTPSNGLRLAEIAFSLAPLDLRASPLNYPHHGNQTGFPANMSLIISSCPGCAPVALPAGVRSSTLVGNIILLTCCTTLPPLVAPKVFVPCGRKGRSFRAFNGKSFSMSLAKVFPLSFQKSQFILFSFRIPIFLNN